MEYRQQGWDVIPLRSKTKNPPPDGWTGGVNKDKFADDDQIQEWYSDYPKGNIAVHPGRKIIKDGQELEVIGIDIDDYSDKNGWATLQELEAKLGPLPDTYTSSARIDGRSGIRWVLTPYGYSYKGKAGTGIDIIQHTHRFGVVFPSWHPETKGQYWWYKPGETPLGHNTSDEIPAVQDLPIIPSQWFAYLRKGARAFGDELIDETINKSDLNAWFELTLNRPGLCIHVKNTVKQWLREFKNSADHHDPLINVHWNLLHMGAEGHKGVGKAVDVVNKTWIKRSVADGSRALWIAKAELGRSQDNALRKIKAQIDSNAIPLVDLDPCDIPPPDNLKGIHWDFGTVDPGVYDNNDKGQAEHFLARVGDNVRWLSDYKAWIYYDGKTWVLDQTGCVHSLFLRACVESSKERSMQLTRILADNPPTNQNQVDVMKTLAKKLKAIALHYGNEPKTKTALNVFKTFFGVSMLYKELNWDATVLAMPSGKVLKLVEPGNKPKPTSPGFHIQDNEKRFYTTLSTGVDYKPFEAIDLEEKALWKGYLDLFLPPSVAVGEDGEEVLDLSYRKFVQKALGHILIGSNPHKLAIFLVGKSDSGKTTMIKAVQAALDSYSSTFQPNSVFKDGAPTNPELGNLLHCRGIFTSESGSQRIHGNPFKRNTGGDPISVTRKYANEQIKGVPHFVPIVATNQPPTIEDADQALIKRIMVLPFNFAVDEEHNNTRMDTIIEQRCQHAVLSWLVDGYKRYIREGLDWSKWHPEALVATKEFATQLNDVASFIDQYCEVAPDEIRLGLNKMPGGLKELEAQKKWLEVSHSKLYGIYKSEMAGAKNILTTRQFSKQVKQLFGVELRWARNAEDGKHASQYVGLRWRNKLNQVSTSDTV